MKKSHKNAFRIAGIYLLFGVLWISLSDRLLATFVNDGAAFHQFQTYKGWGFILVTAILVFLLTRKALGDQERLTATLARSEERFQLAMLAANDGLWDWNLQTDEVYYSPRWKSMLGYADEELGNHLDTWKKLVHPDDLEPTLTAARDAIAGRLDPYEVRFRMRHKGGGYVDILSRAYRVHGQPGEPPRLVGTHTDITQRVRAEGLLRTRLQLSELGQKGGYDELMQIALDAAEQLTGSSIGFFHLVDPDQNTLLLQSWSTNTLEHACQLPGKGMHYPVEQAGVWVECIETRRPVIHQDYASLPQKKGLPEGHAPVIRELTVPVLRNGLVVAIMGVGNKPVEYTQADVDAVQELASMVMDQLARKQAEDDLRESLQRYQTLVENIPGTVFRCQLEFPWRVAHISSSVQAITGIEARRILDGTTNYGDLVHPDDRPIVEKAVSEGIANHCPYETQYRLRHTDGTARWVFERGRAIYADDGKPLWLDGVIVDMTERILAETAQRESERALRQAQQAARIGSYSYDIAADVWSSSPVLDEIFGIDADYPRTAAGWTQLVHPENREQMLAYLGECIEQRRRFDIEYRIVRADDAAERWVLGLGEIEYAPDGQPLRMAGTIQDITERKRYEQELEFQATHDALTGLANRYLMTDRLSQNLIFADRSERIVAVLLLDLDRFKVVNDSLGHSHGDELLRMVAERLSACVRAGDTVSRFGGDEFVVTLAEVAELDDVGLLAKRFQDALLEPFRMAGHELHLSASIGVSLYPKDGSNAETLLRHADVAMYRAKEDGGNAFRFFAPEMNLRIQGVLELEADLRLALERGEFLLHFQPQIEFASGRIVGCEALVRWQHPRRGLVSPGDFIPVAEETGLIVPLGEWVLRAACAQGKDWQSLGLPPVRIAVNLSARQFSQADLVERVRLILEQSDLAPGTLEVELTESMVMHDPAGAVRTMGQLKELGVRLCLDDFGTGHSSLNYLRRFPVDYLKIDRSFITDAATDSSDAAVASSIVAIAHSLGIKAIAEGVETWEQHDFLAQVRCDEFQGFLFARPLPASEFAGLLREDRRLAGPHAG